jgi:predicted aconitase with swiveling domain/ADP-ribose pyrophosphatase YjhB (NUDIX family)
MRLEARRIYGGRARGEALVFPQPISLLGGIDSKTGQVLDAASGLRGSGVRGKVMVFPGGKGSTAGSYVLYSLKARGKAPSALVCDRAEAVVATGAIISEIPMVDQVQTDLFRTGDVVTVEAEEGYVEIEGVELRHVVTSFLRFGDRILLLRRSEDVGSFPGHWAGVSGYIEGHEEAEERARMEIEEETGFRDVRLLAAGEVVMARGREGNTVWAVHPFIFEVPGNEVTLDWEHVEYRWVRPEEMGQYMTVPKLQEALDSAMKALRRPL